MVKEISAAQHVTKDVIFSCLGPTPEFPVEGDGNANARDTVAARTMVTRAREACIDGLRVLAYMAMADETVTLEEVNIETSYIKSRLATVGMNYSAALTDAMLAISQGLVVSKRSLTRAINIVAADRQHFKLLLDAVLQMFEVGRDSRGLHKVLWNNVQSRKGQRLDLSGLAPFQLFKSAG